MMRMTGACREKRRMRPKRLLGIGIPVKEVFKGLAGGLFRDVTEHLFKAAVTQYGTVTEKPNLLGSILRQATLF